MVPAFWSLQCNGGVTVPRVNKQNYTLWLSVKKEADRGLAKVGRKLSQRGGQEVLSEEVTLMPRSACEKKPGMMRRRRTPIPSRKPQNTAIPHLCLVQHF